MAMAQIILHSEIEPSERDFLLYACRSVLGLPYQRPTPEQAPRNSAAWRRILNAAGAHGVSQLLAIACQGRSDLPADLASALKKRSFQSASISIHQAHQLVNVMGVLEAASVQALAVKGPALAVLAYPNAGLRPSVDLDILVSPDEAERAIGAMLCAGFKRTEIPIADTPHRNIENEESLTGPDGHTVVELHWALLPLGHAVPTTFGELWRSAQRVQLPTGSVRTLATDDLLLYLAQHGAKHGWERLMWICDIAMLVPRYSDLEWEVFLRHCRRAGTLRMVLLALMLARDLLSVRLSRPVQQSIRNDSTLGSICARSKRRLFETVHRSEGFSAHARNLLFNLTIRQRMRDRLRFCLWAMKPTLRDHGHIRLPRPLESLYFLLRPLRLIARHWPSGNPDELDDRLASA